ncbi:TetR/AcrR family transcriptional regulator [Paenibacillus sp. FSL K6-2862]|uniref:TetR/AcrR family transcriptional regulator n=1 Tax=Paenibacillus sp. FSL K6-2862 TaxID=2921484 RepID=UPI004046C373
MRNRDDNKVEAIFDATIQLINEIGFSETSISKIAKRASVSAATIYIYHENKEDPLYKTYLKIKGKMSEKMFQEVDHTRTFTNDLRLSSATMLILFNPSKNFFCFWSK